MIHVSTAASCIYWTIGPKYFLCLYIFIYLCIYVFTYSFTYLHFYMFIYFYTFVYLCIYLFIYLFTFLHVYIFSYIYAFIYLVIFYMFIYIFTYLCIHFIYLCMSNFYGFLSLDISLLCDLQTSKGRLHKADLDKFPSHTARYVSQSPQSAIYLHTRQRCVSFSSH